MTVRKRQLLPSNVASYIFPSFIGKQAVLLFALTAVCFGHTNAWRPATEKELKNIIPARAPVEKERIETEFRTASGIVGPNGKYLAGVVLITAGYSAEGKYSHFVTTEVPLKIGTFSLSPGEYVFGSRHEGDGLAIKFYEAQSGRYIGTVDATRQSRIGKIESFRIAPVGDRGLIEIGRFGFGYHIAQP